MKMKLMERTKQKRMDNRGFSLIELIIVIAMMAVLVGLVGTRVVVWLEESREAKDLQIINSFATAAVTTYINHPEYFADEEAGEDEVQFGLLTGNLPAGRDGLVRNEILNLTGFGDYKNGGRSLSDVKNAMYSKRGRNNLQNISVEYNFEDGTVTVWAVSGGRVLFEEIVSHI